MDGSPAQKPYVGGQAVIEGVMMRSPRSMAIAARRPDGTIVVKEEAWISLFERLRFLRWPFFRGAVVLLESLYNGIQALNFSSLVQAEEAAIQRTGGSAPPADAPREPPPVAAATAPSTKDKLATAVTIAISFALALGLFVALPHLMAWGAGAAAGQDLGVDSFGFHALDGLFKIGIFVAYIWLIGRIPEIRRVFQYHGAEHKAINAYEHGEELTVENAKRWTTFHARCGTSFVLFVLVLSIFLFAGVFPFIPTVSSIAVVNHLAMVAIKIPLMIPLAGLAYEINKYAAAHPGAWWVQALVVPGRLMQRLTTHEPDDDQLEIALAAMRAALRREAELATISLADARSIKAAEAAAPLGGRVVVYRDFGEVASALSLHA
jgi:uncharacterized protein YqhQ